MKQQMPRLVFFTQTQQKIFRQYPPFSYPTSLAVEKHVRRYFYIVSTRAKRPDSTCSLKSHTEKYVKKNVRLARNYFGGAGEDSPHQQLYVIF